MWQGDREEAVARIQVWEAVENDIKQLPSTFKGAAAVGGAKGRENQVHRWPLHKIECFFKKKKTKPTE